jgi:hypothetical protein
VDTNAPRPQKDMSLASAKGIVSLIPGLGIIWGIAEAYYGAGLKLRQERALNWVEMMRDNPSVFTAELLQDEQFQDGFVYSLEQFLRQRNYDKRRIAKNIFLGFSTTTNKADFPLERFTHVLNILHELDIAALVKLYPENIVREHIVNGTRWFSRLGSINQERGNMLLSLGIIQFAEDRSFGPNNPHVELTDFGKQLVQYIIADETESD